MRIFSLYVPEPNCYLHIFPYFTLKLDYLAAVLSRPQFQIHCRWFQGERANSVRGRVIEIFLVYPDHFVVDDLAPITVAEKTTQLVLAWRQLTGDFTNHLHLITWVQPYRRIVRPHQGFSHNQDPLNKPALIITDCDFSRNQIIPR